MGSSDNTAKKYPTAGATIEVTVNGVMDSGFKFPDLPDSGLEAIVIDWKRLKYLNSEGIKIWLEWVQGVRKKHEGVQFLFRNTPVFIINIINTVKGVLPPGSRVLSFEVPLECVKCDKAGVAQMFDNSGETTPTPTEILERIKKKSCGKPNCEFEVDAASSYFRFLSFKE